MKLVIPKAVEKKIHDYVMSVDTEIAGMGKVRVDGDSIIVEEVMIYEQQVTGGTADLSPQAIANWQCELVRRGESPKQWTLWWHSHANMAAFFSGRDTATIDLQSEGEWMVSLVVNKRRERECRLDTYRPFRLKLEKLAIEIQGGIDAYVVPADIVAEVAAKVKAPPVTNYYAKPHAAPCGFHDKKGLFDMPRTVDAMIEKHRWCPKNSKLAFCNMCYMPYGEVKGAAYADCTSKAFKKTYGKHPFKTNEVEVINGERAEEETTSVDKVTAMATIRTLEAQIKQHDNNGTSQTEDCVMLLTELADWYYLLADLEGNESVAEAMRAEARVIENDISDGAGKLLAEHV